MYESHFGFSGSPFQLNPDPAFYYDSRGHSNALAYLKFGAHQGEGFIVVTGEIGAGKTTLVRTLLEGLNPEQVVAAQVVSTQLESGELLQAILMSFGIASPSTSKAHLIGTLEAFLTSLAAKGRRALLIIDEAQNLKHEAVEELRMLSNFQLGKYGLLQSFLVGQPELRQLLQSKSMEQLRQRVIASCHLGPLASTETRAYVEHRLKRVGWTNRPEFMPDAFDRIHSWTGGVPRKINRLCNRLLLGAFLNNEEVITLASVDRTAEELKGEIGELSEVVELPSPAPVAVARTEAPKDTVELLDQPAVANAATAVVAQPVVAVALEHEAAIATEARAKVKLVPAGSHMATAEGPQTSQSTRSGAGDFVTGTSSDVAARSDGASTGRTEGRGALTIVPAYGQVAEHPAAAQPNPGAMVSVAHGPPVRVHRRTYREGALDGPLLCLVDSTSDFLKIGSLTEVFLKFPALPPLIALHLGAKGTLSFGDTGANELPMPFVGLHLEGLADAFSMQTRQVLEVFEQLLAEYKPRGILALGNSNAALVCSLLARKQAVPLYRVGGGQRQTLASEDFPLNGALIDKVADVLYVNRMDSYYTLYQEGIKSDKVLCVGNLIGDMLKFALPHAPSLQEILTNSHAKIGDTDDASGILLVAVNLEESVGFQNTATELASVLNGLAAEGMVIWLVNEQTQTHLQESGLLASLEESRVTVLSGQGYLQMLGLLENAKCLITDAEAHLIEEAASLRIPTLHLTYDLESAEWVATPVSASATGATEKPLQSVRHLLENSASQGDTPAYWDSGTATRIANHLMLSLAQRDNRVPVKA